MTFQFYPFALCLLKISYFYFPDCYSIFQTRHILEMWKDRQTYAIIFLSSLKLKMKKAKCEKI